MRPATVLVVIAHPADESFRCGALIAGQVARGNRVVVCCASRGELEEDASGQARSGGNLGAVREAELRQAARILGVGAVEFLPLRDSGWNEDAGSDSMITGPGSTREAVARRLRAHRPDVVVTMDPTEGVDGPEHAAIGAATTSAFHDVVDWPASLYHWCLPSSLVEAWGAEMVARNLKGARPGTERGRPDASITTVLDGAGVLDVAWRAIEAHVTQRSPHAGLSPQLAERFIRFDHLVRQVPAWEGDEGVETELLRPQGW